MLKLVCWLYCSSVVHSFYSYCQRNYFFHFILSSVQSRKIVLSNNGSISFVQYFVVKLHQTRENALVYVNV